MIVDVHYNQDIYEFVQGDKIPWNEIYNFGRNEEKGYLPSDHGPEINHFSDEPRLRRALEVQLHKVQQRLDGLTTRILGGQEQERKILLQQAQEIATGTFQGILNVGTPATLEEFQRRLRQGIEEMASEEYQNRLRTMPIVSVDIGDMIVYAGLVRVARGLQQFLQEGKYDPAVAGDVVSVYNSLSN